MAKPSMDQARVFTGKVISISFTDGMSIAMKGSHVGRSPNRQGDTAGGGAGRPVFIQGSLKAIGS
jgi:hypothetical protein